jgi:hypothetical protein
MPRKPRTLLEVCTARLGVHKGALAAAWLVEYALATRDLGHVPSGREYAAWAFVDDRTAWRRRSALREVFGDDRWVEVVEALAAQVEPGRSIRGQVALPVPA